MHTLNKYKTEFYDYHRNEKKTMLYSHALIYSPRVIIFKHGNGEPIEKTDGYYECDMITSPAVNAGCYLKRAKISDHMMQKHGLMDGEEKVGEDGRRQAAMNVIEHAMKERCQRVLELAMKHENEYLILGAWGCGVFGNEPTVIAQIFANLLKNRYRNVFSKVVFAILDCKKKKTIDEFIREFEKVFGSKGLLPQSANLLG